MTPLTIGSLFSGIGGLELGLERGIGHGAHTVWQVEQNEYCRAVLAKHWPDATRYEDVRHVGRTNLAPVDVICGGFPCQDVSNAGRRAGVVVGTRSGLWYQYSRIIRELRPRYVVVENVAALLTLGLDAVLGELAESGYDAEWDCVPASAVGAPHRRDRVFVLAYPSRAGRETWAGDGMGTHHGARGNERQSPRADREACAMGDAERNDGRAGGAGGSDSANSREPLTLRALPSVADATDGRRASHNQQRHTKSVHARTRCPGSAGGWWAAEPDMGRVADGVPYWVDRIHALGNAVVPQVAEVVGRLIAQRELAQERAA